MMLGRLTAAMAAFAVLAGCATTPPVTVHYYLAQGAMELTVIRTVGCDEGNLPIIATSVVAKMAYSRDPASRRSLALRSLDGSFANTQVDFVLTEDGRLNTLNSTQTGQGAEVVKSAIALTTAAFALDGGTPSYPDECAFIRQVAKDKPITLTFRHYEGFATRAQGGYTPIMPIPDSALYYSRVRNMIGSVCRRIGPAASQPAVRAQAPAGDRRMVYLGLREPGLASVQVSEGPGACGETPFWETTVQVPQYGQDFDLPLPRSALFGKQSVVLVLGDSGAITTLKVGKDSGAAASLNAATEVANRLVETDGEEAARLKAEADVIAQQQRLIRCHLNPTACT